MNRSLVILLSTLVLGTAIFVGAYFVSQRTAVMCCSSPTDDLSWLRDEFHLNDADMAHIRQLHKGYMPQCAEMCAKIAKKKSELEVALANRTNITSAANTKLIELGELRAQCQSQVLQHFVNVSQAMPPEQGRRYLADMEKLTLGLHEEIEQSMPDRAGHEHGTN